jgi:hypothetical protein
MTHRFDPKVIGLVPPDDLAHLGVVAPVPVLDLPPADGRKWCVAALRWLEGERPRGCPTADLDPDGSCRRSPTGGRCLLLLPGDHLDWQAARRYRYDEERDVICLREQPAPVCSHPPLTLAEFAPAQPPASVWAALARLEARVAADLDDLRRAGYPIVVDARTLVAAELGGCTLDLETGERN